MSRKPKKVISIDYTLPNKLVCTHCGADISHLTDLEHAIVKLGDCPNCDYDIVLIGKSRREGH
jgi:hypothetical protein